MVKDFAAKEFLADQKVQSLSQRSKFDPLKYLVNIVRPRLLEQETISKQQRERCDAEIVSLGGVIN